MFKIIMNRFAEEFNIISGYPRQVWLALASLAFCYGLKKLLFFKNKNPKPEMGCEEALAALEARKPSNLWNTAMFFPDWHADEADSTTQQFLWYFQQARTSIRVCIYNFSFPELEYVITQQYARGLIVQFVVGQEATADSLRRKSIPCGVYPRDGSTPQTDQLMHHKFALIDDEAVLVGSMNWTTEGILNNSENICVSTNSRHVSKYLEEYFRLMAICEKAKTFY